MPQQSTAMPKRFGKKENSAKKSPTQETLSSPTTTAPAYGKVDDQESRESGDALVEDVVREIIEAGLGKLKEWLDIRFQQQYEMQLQREEALVQRISRLTTKMAKNSDGVGDIMVEERVSPALLTQTQSVPTHVPSNGARENTPLLATMDNKASSPPALLGKSYSKSWPARKDQSVVQDWQSRFVDVFDQLDLDRSGEIDRYEFMEAFADAQIPDISAFKVLNMSTHHGHHSIDRAEWLQILSEAVKSPEEEIKLLIEFLDRLAKLQSERGGNIYADRFKQPPLIIRHDKPVRMTWDMFLCILLFYVSVSVPFSLGFGQSDVLDRIDLITDILFCIDVMLNFRTTYLDSEEFIIMDGKLIAMRYLKSWFLLDFISSVPFDAVTVGLLPNLTPARLVKIGKVSKVLKLLRLSKIMTVLAESEATERLEAIIHSKGYQTFARIFKLVLMAFIVAHWLACFGNFIDEDQLNSYFEGQDPNAMEKYLAGIYWAMTTLSTVGYGDITPKSDEERVYAMVAMVIGGSMYGYVIGSVTSIVTDLDVTSHAYQERLELIQSWLDCHDEIPSVLRRRLRKYFQRSLGSKTAMEDGAVVAELSPELRAKTAYFLVHDSVRNHPMFEMCGSTALAKLVEVLRRVHINKNERIVNFGDPGTAAYILVDGLARYEQGVPWFPPDVSVHAGRFQQVNKGDSFGEEIIFGMAESYTYTIISLTDCDFHSISEDDFQGAYANMRDWRDQMQRSWLESRREVAQRKTIDVETSAQPSYPLARQAERSAPPKPTNNKESKIKK